VSTNVTAMITIAVLRPIHAAFGSGVGDSIEDRVMPYQRPLSSSHISAAATSSKTAKDGFPPAPRSW
jgi:hypothetical protein